MTQKKELQKVAKASTKLQNRTVMTWKQIENHTETCLTRPATLTNGTEESSQSTSSASAKDVISSEKDAGVAEKLVETANELLERLHATMEELHAEYDKVSAEDQD